MSDRRDFLRGAGGLLSAAWLAGQLPMVAKAATAARDQGRGFAFLDEFEAAELEALCACIFPTDETPGAREIGVIWFIDQAMGGFMAGAIHPLRQGLTDVARRTTELAGPDARFSALGEDAQHAIMGAIESEPYFGLIQLLTAAGMFAMPGYGGNRDELGWQLIGFDHRHAWQPPFGYYDAQHSEPTS